VAPYALEDAFMHEEEYNDIKNASSGIQVNKMINMRQNSSTDPNWTKIPPPSSTDFLEVDAKIQGERRNTGTGTLKISANASNNL